MYAGHVVEQGTTEQILKNPRHPYTNGLLASVPKLEEEEGEKLIPIPGTPPNLTDFPDECPFIPRCKYVCDKCKTSKMPPLVGLSDEGHYLACYVDICGEVGK